MRSPPDEIRLIEEVADWLDGMADKIRENDIAGFANQLSPLLDWGSDVGSKIRFILKWLLLNMPGMAEAVENDYEVIRRAANIIIDVQGEAGWDYSDDPKRRKAVKENRIVVKQKVKELARTFRQIAQKAREKLTEAKTKQSGSKVERRTQKKRQRPPLPDNYMAVLELLENLPERKGLTGKQILQALDEKKIYIDQSTLTKGIIPRLRDNGYGVKNKRNGAGYYIVK